MHRELYRTILYRSKFLKTIEIRSNFQFRFVFSRSYKTKRNNAFICRYLWYNEFVLIVRNNFFRVPTNARELFIRIDQTDDSIARV